MADRRIFSLDRSALNPFLFSEVGVEANGLSLSVVSMLARDGKDPWDEAAGLAAMPGPRAVERLAAMIAAMPAALWPLPAATDIASRLVSALPAGAPAPILLAAAEPKASLVTQWSGIVAAALLIVLISVLAFQYLGAS